MGGKRNFNGCWTCRIRKVKCDTTRPNCNRCVKAGLSCEGYDIKLSFYQALTIRHGELIDIAEKNEKEDKHSRRTMKLGEFPRKMVYETYKELDQIIDQVDKSVDKGQVNRRVGPFSVYEITHRRLLASLNNLLNPGTLEYEDSVDETAPINRKRSPVEEREEDQYPYDGMELDPESNHLIGSQINRKSREIEPSISKSGGHVDGPREELIHADLIKLAKLSIYGIKGPQYKIDDQNIYHISYPTYFPNIDSDEWTPTDHHLKKLIIIKKEGKLMTTTFLELIDSFSHLRFGVVKVPHEHNCWDRLVKPYIIQILFEHCLGELSLEDDLHIDHESLDNNIPNLIKNLKLITVLLVISISSFNKSTNKFRVDTNEDIDSNLRISIILRKIGLNLLNYHLDEYDNHIELKNQEYNLLLLLNIILQIEIDNYYNIFENFELLFSIGEMLMYQDYSLKTIGSFGQVTTVMINIFKIMYTFFFSTQRINVYNYKMSEEDLDRYEDLKDNYDLSKLQDNDSELEDEAEAEGYGPGDEGKDEEKGDKRGEEGDTDQDFKEPTIVESNRTFIDRSDYNDYTNDIGFKPELDELSVNSVYLLYGIPQSLMKLFYDIINLTNHKHVFYIEQKYPRNFPKICSEYEDKLEKWTNKWELTNSHGYKSQWHKSLAYNIEVFHQSLKIYFRRLIKNEIHQHLIESVVNEIKQLQQLNNDILINFWTILINSSDNLNQELNSFFTQLSGQYDNLTYWRSKQLMIEVNKRRENHDPISWMEMIREWDILLYLG